MKSACGIAQLIVLLALAVRLPCLADDQAAQSALRATITKSLGFLAREGDQWMEDKSCNGCHHMPELLWSHREAKRRGFAVDQSKLDEWIEWANPKTKDTGPGLEQAGLMLLALPEKPLPEATQAILKGQLPDGSWKPAGQFADMQRRGPPDAKSNSARLFLLALAASDASPQVVAETRKKAAALLEKTDPPTTVETWVFRGLYARKFGTPEELEAVRGEILKLQHEDGGWAYVVGQATSDALGTGQVLYLLGQVPAAPDGGAVERAQRWLQGTQREDGGWTGQSTLFSKIDRTGPQKAKSLKDVTGIYTFWGSAWATIGLLQWVPVKDGASASGATVLP